MRLGDYLRPELVIPDLESRSKPEALAELLAPLAVTNPEIDIAKAQIILLEREQLGTTGIGGGIAIPHGKLASLEGILLVVGRSRGGVEFESLDNRPCNIFFMVLAPEQAAGMHLRLLAHISRLLEDEGFRRTFMEAEDRDELWRLLHNQ